MTIDQSTPRYGAFLFLAATAVLLFSQSASAQWTPNGNDVYKTNTSGNVGIGTISPQSPLQVVYPFGKTDVSPRDGFEISSSDSSGRFKLYFKAKGAASLANRFVWLQTGDDNVADGGNLLLQPNAGNVGIGTTSPGFKLDVQSGSTGGWASSVLNTSNSGAVQMAHGAGFGMYIDPGSNAGAGTYALLIAKSGTSYVFVRGDGNVGIGTSTPSQKLDVYGNVNVSGPAGSGNISVSGTINAKYQDVAEWVPSSEKLAAGTVVALDATKSNQVVASTTAYDTRVAGVISVQPGITLGEKSDDKVLVATTGRVRVKVDASRGPIAIGDLLVTSDIPGVAMKSIPVEFAGRQMHMPGTIIGKALEPLAKGKGEILVLLSLQ
ncbi:MAG TPA: hypothetical protein VJW17_12695 [Pyrinomonadaceae bacterium]|nr:hypothetical protein [Pyrinomonadaceae bacterium]